MGVYLSALETGGEESVRAWALLALPAFFWTLGLEVKVRARHCGVGVQGKLCRVRNCKGQQLRRSSLQLVAARRHGACGRAERGLGAYAHCCARYQSVRHGCCVERVKSDAVAAVTFGS